MVCLSEATPHPKRFLNKAVDPRFRPKKEEDPITIDEEQPNPIVWRKIQSHGPSFGYTVLLFAVYLLFERAVVNRDRRTDEASQKEISALDSPKEARQKLNKICEEALRNYNKICPPKEEGYNFECVVRHALGDDGQVSDPMEFITVICARHRLIDSL